MPTSPKDKDGEVKNDTPAEEVVDMDKQATTVADPDVAKTGIKFVEDKLSQNKEDLSALAEAKSKELEEQFKSELSSTEPTRPTSKPAELKTGTLSTLLSKIQEKLGIKKKKVKTELGSLKEMKDSITQDIADIKKLEDSEEKIKSEMGKIDTIGSEVESIEREVADELKD